MQRTDCAYLAGLIDADGYIGFERFGGQRTPTVKMHLTNRDRKVLEAMQELWGGRIYDRSGRNPHWQPTSDLRWHGSLAVRRVLSHIRPYLRIKATQADCALLFTETVDSSKSHNRRGLSRATVAIREAISEVFTALNHRGIEVKEITS